MRTALEQVRLMTLDRPNVVDAIGIENESGQVVMSIADHLEWEPLQDHLIALQNKINAYIAFIENNEFEKSYPNGLGRPIRIELCCKYPPIAEAQEFLAKASEVIRGAGWMFSWRVLSG
jgi:hypothetical protein